MRSRHSEEIPRRSDGLNRDRPAAPRSGARAPIAALMLFIGLSGAVAIARSSDVSKAAEKSPLVDSVDAIGITVSDLDRAIGFYRDVLGFSVVHEEESSGAALEQLTGVFGAHVRSARLALGEQAIVLMQYLTPRGRPIPPDMRSNDRAFQHVAIVVSDMERAYLHLRQHHVRYVSTEPQTLPAWNRGAAGIKAFYFADPDDHTLEVIWFPPGKGDPRWQRLIGADVGSTPRVVPLAPIFLGIDHTAIGVADTSRSLRLYKDALGFRVAGESENYGTEQEHLNAVFGAHLRITALRSKAGPGIELLEYLSPRDGRAAPLDQHTNDLGHWQTVLRARDLPSSIDAATTAGATGAPGRSVDLIDATFRIRQAALINDPDGHGLMLAH